MKLFRVSLPDLGAQDLAQKLLSFQIEFNIKYNNQDDVVVFESNNPTLIHLFDKQVNQKV